MKETLKTVTETLRNAGIYPFRVESSYADSNAERNLQGRTYFLSPETRRYFKSRVLDAGMSKDGLVFWLVESNRSKPFEPEKNKRFVAFDVFGTVLIDREDWFKTSAQAMKHGRAWLESFDSLEHTRKELLAKATRDAEQAQAIFNALL